MDKSKRLTSRFSRQRKNRRLIPVQISYAEPESSVVVTVNVKPGTSIREAFELSNIQKIAKNANLVKGQIGIFGEIKSPDTILEENDRVEIYRPLAVTPKESKKKRAAQTKPKSARQKKQTKN